MKRVVLLMLPLLIGSFSMNIVGQVKPPWITQVENVIRQKERAWKISEKSGGGSESSFHETIILKYGRLRADISIDVLDSPERAKEQFDGEEIAFTNILEKHSVKSKLEDLGDNNFMFTGKRGPRKYGNIFFRQGKVVVKVFAPSAETAKRFAKYVIEQTPRPNDDPQSKNR